MSTESVSVYETMSEAWVSELRRTISDGALVAPRGMQTLERVFVQFEVLRPMSLLVRCEGRTMRDTVGYLEGLSMVAQANLATTFTDRVKNFGQFTNDGIFYGAYGSRLHGQLGDLVARLKSDESSRQAVLTIFDGGRDLAAAKRDIPCTISVQFLLRDDELMMKVSMRSNDVWLGTPYDLTQFAILQATVAQAVGAEPGVYAHSAGSLHLYERDLEKAQQVDYPKDGGPMFPFPLWKANDLEGMVTRAQRVLLAPDFVPMTEFELDAWEDLHA